MSSDISNSDSRSQSPYFDYENQATGKTTRSPASKTATPVSSTATTPKMTPRPSISQETPSDLKMNECAKKNLKVNESLELEKLYAMKQNRQGTLAFLEARNSNRVDYLRYEINELDELIACSPSRLKLDAFIDKKNQLVGEIKENKKEKMKLEKQIHALSTNSPEKIANEHRDELKRVIEQQKKGLEDILKNPKLPKELQCMSNMSDEDLRATLYQHKSKILGSQYMLQIIDNKEKCYTALENIATPSEVKETITKKQALLSKVDKKLEVNLEKLIMLKDEIKTFEKEHHYFKAELKEHKSEMKSLIPSFFARLLK